MLDSVRLLSSRFLFSSPSTYTSVRSSSIPSRTDMNLGEIGSMRKLGVTESYKLKRQVVSSASEAAEMILR